MRYKKIAHQTLLFFEDVQILQFVSACHVVHNRMKKCAFLKLDGSKSLCNKGD